MITWLRLWHLASSVKIRGQSPSPLQGQTMEIERTRLRQTFSQWHLSPRRPSLQVQLSVITWRVAPMPSIRPLAHLIKSTLLTILSTANFSSKPMMHTSNIGHQVRCCRVLLMKIIITTWLWLRRRTNKIKKIKLPCNQLNLKTNPTIMERLSKWMKTKTRPKFKRAQQPQLFKTIKRPQYHVA